MIDKYAYEVNLTWDKNSVGTLKSPILDNVIAVATPPEFPGGEKGVWSPEHLFVASVNSCLMSTFIAIMNNSKLSFISYTSNAVGEVENIDNKLSVTSITIRPTITIAMVDQKERVLRILTMSEHACAISNSIKTKLSIEPTINFQH